MYLSSKLGKKAFFTVDRESKFKTAYDVDPENRKRNEMFNTLLDSLVCNTRFEGRTTLLDFPCSSRGTTTPYCPYDSPHPKDKGGGVPLCHTEDGNGPSPYPSIDLFIAGEIGKEGGRPGSIRRWTFFPQGKILVYDIKDNRWCGNIGREHKSNNIMIVVDLSLGAFYQKCYDPDCRKANYRSKDRILPTEVNPVCYQQETTTTEHESFRQSGKDSDTFLENLSDAELDAIINGDTEVLAGVLCDTCTSAAAPVEHQPCQGDGKNPPQNQWDKEDWENPSSSSLEARKDQEQEQTLDQLFCDYGTPVEALKCSEHRWEESGEATPTSQNDALNISVEEMRSFLEEPDEIPPADDQVNISSDEMNSFLDMNTEVPQQNDKLESFDQGQVDTLKPLTASRWTTSTGALIRHDDTIGDIWAVLLGDEQLMEHDEGKMSHHDDDEENKNGSDHMEEMTSSQWDSFVNQ